MMGANGTCRTKSLHQALLICLLVLSLLLGCILWADEAFAAEKTGTVVIDALNVRTAPGTLNQALGLIYMGEKVTILGTEKDYSGTAWYMI